MNCDNFLQVLNFLSKSQRQSKGKRPNGRGQNLATITYEVRTQLRRMLEVIIVYALFSDNRIPFKNSCLSSGMGAAILQFAVC